MSEALSSTARCSTASRSRTNALIGLRPTVHAVPAKGEHGEASTAYTGAMKRPNRAYEGPADGEAAKGGHMRGGHRLGASLGNRSGKILRFPPRRCQTSRALHVISAVASLTALNDSTIAPSPRHHRARDSRALALVQEATIAGRDCAMRFWWELDSNRGVLFRGDRTK